MLHPAHIDGRTLVILRRRGSVFRPMFDVVISGRLEHDGSKLTLIGDGIERVIAEPEQDMLMPVKPDSRIPQCNGFDLFMIEEAARVKREGPVNAPGQSEDATSESD